MNLTRAELDAALADLRRDYPLDGWEYFDDSRVMLVTKSLSMNVGYAGDRISTDTLRWLASESKTDTDRMGRTAIEAVSALKRSANVGAAVVPMGRRA